MAWANSAASDRGKVPLTSARCLWGFGETVVKETNVTSGTGAQAHTRDNRHGTLKGLIGT